MSKLTVDKLDPNLQATWGTLTKLVPELLDIYSELKQTRDDKRQPFFCANNIWYGREGPRRRMAELIGMVRQKRMHDDETEEWLRSSEAYDVAYEVLYEVLPDCRNCLCM